MKLYKNILTEKERKKLLRFVKTKVKYWNDKVPGLQTPMNLHTHPETQHFDKKMLQKYFKDMSIQYSWANYSEGDIINWHNHPASVISAVYFLKNPELMKKQISDCEETLNKIRSKTSSSDESALVLTKFLTS